MHLNNQLLFEKHALPYFTSGARVLEIGPGKTPSWMQSAVDVPVTWETAELLDAVDPTTGERKWGPPDGKEATYWLSDGYTIPLEDGTFDVVVSASVFEHVPMIWDWMRELCRVTRPGGFVVTLSPTSWPYHESPVDCWRVFPEGMRALNSFVGLETVVCVCDSLEPRLSRRSFPGVGILAPPQRQSLPEVVRRLVGWPRQVSFDVLTVARKPAQRVAANS